MTHRFVPSMSSTAISIAVRDEIQRFESVHPNIYSIHDAIEDIENARAQQQIRQYILAIEDAFVNSQEWTLSRSVIDLKLGIVGTFNSGKASLVHRYLTGSYIYEDSFEGGRFKKEVTIEGQSYLLLIREEGGPPDMQFSQWVDAVVFVFSVDSETSFNSLYSYFAKMSLHRNMSEVPIILVATQDSINEANPRHINDARARKMASDFKNSIYIEVCSSYGLNVDRVFNEACHRMLNMRLASMRGFGASSVTLAKATNRSHSNPKYSDHSSTNSSINSIYQPSSLSLQNGFSNGDSQISKVSKKYASDTEKVTYNNSIDDFTQIDLSTENLKNNNFKSIQKPIKMEKSENKYDNAFSRKNVKYFSFHERLDSFFKEKDKRPGLFSRHRSYSIQSIEQSDDGTSKDFVTPNTTPTPGRKSRRKSNLFMGKKELDEKKLKNGDSKLGIGRLIPIKQGWLYKRSNKPLSKDWQKKYVTLLDDGRLTYHSSLQDYMGNSHGKEIKLGRTTVKIPGQRPRGSEISRLSFTNRTTLSNRCSTSSISVDQINENSVNTVLRTNIESGSQSKSETPIAKKKHRRIKSTSKNLDTNGDDNEGGFEFIIVSLDNKQWHFEATSYEEREEWVTAVEQQILYSLQMNRSTKIQIPSLDNIAAMHALRSLPGNDKCADCSNPNPEWGSLNLGALVCIECSGIHRNLGSHISRVRSLELDEWTSTMVQVMSGIGNSVTNSIYEAGALSNKSKPISSSSREEKDKWIRSKYEQKQYLPPLPYNDIPIHQQLMDAVARQDIGCTVLILAYCQPSHVNTPHSMNDTRTALHIAAAIGNIILIQLLLWYGANPELIDHEGHNSLFYAKFRPDCLKILESHS